MSLNLRNQNLIQELLQFHNQLIFLFPVLIYSYFITIPQFVTYNHSLPNHHQFFSSIFSCLNRIYSRQIQIPSNWANIIKFLTNSHPFHCLQKVFQIPFQYLAHKLYKLVNALSKNVIILISTKAMPENNFSVPNDENNVPREFSSQSEQFSLFNFNSQQSLEYAQSESRDYRSVFEQDISGFQYDFGSSDLSYQLFFQDQPQNNDSSISCLPQQGILQEYHQLNHNVDRNENLHISPDQILVSPNQKNGHEISNQQIPVHRSVQITILSDQQETSVVFLPQSDINLEDKGTRAMNDMMRQTFVALQSCLDDIHFPLDYGTLECSQTQEKIRHMFDVLKLFMEKIKRKLSGNQNQKVKSIPMKKAAMILFNLVNLQLNKDLRHIKIHQVQYYLDECQRLEESIINQAKYLFRQQVRELMTRDWIYQMSLRAKFRKRDKKQFRQFLQKYMQHVAIQLYKDQIDPRAFDRDYIIQNYASFVQ